MTAATTRACPKCSTAVAADSKFCPNCGAGVSGIFSGGGTPLDGTAAFGIEEVDTLFPILQDATLGDYDIYGELGRGGMAAVYLALDLSLNRKVAIKTMLPDLVGKTGMVDRFKREAQTAAALSHPHIIQIFSVKQTKNLVYFVMKYIEGRSLESVIIERGKLDVDLTRVILSQVGAALAFAHRKGVVHRDMKPANIMLEEDGWAIVTDFGIAKVQEAQNLTATGTAIGTPHYMSPEQFHNKAVTGASDQYSLGIVAYEMLTGKKPFDGATYAEIITQHLFEPPPDLRVVRPDIPANVADAVMKMMAKDSSARFPDLDAAVQSLGTPTTTQGEKARTQIISIARSGPERKVRLSVPQSPVPAQRKSPAPTVVESAAGKAAAGSAKKAGAPSPRPQVEERKSPTLIIAAAVILLLGGGFGGWYKFVRKPATDGGNPVPTQAGLPANSGSSGAQNQDSIAKAVIADSIARAYGDSVARADSIIKATAAAGARQRQSAQKTAQNPKTTPPANRPAAASNTTPVTTSVTPPQTEAPKPVAPAEGSITIGSRTPNATLFIRGVPQAGGMASIATVKVKAGDVRIGIQAEKCTPWDTTVSVAAGDTVMIGRRNLVCPP